MTQHCLRSIDSWETLDLRMSVFLESAMDLLDTVSWSAMFNTLPDTHSSQPKAGIAEAAGEFDNGQLVLRTMPGRVDLVFQLDPNPQNILQGPILPVLGKASDVIGRFKNPVNKVLNQLRTLSDIKVSRIAYGANLLLPLPSKESAYTALNELLHSVDVDVASSDLQYSINRKRKSCAVTELEVNRLSIWSAMQFDLHLNGQIVSNINEFACRLALDINTVPNPNFFIPSNELEPCFLELINLGSEIAEYGDIP